MNLISEESLFETEITMKTSEGGQIAMHEAPTTEGYGNG